MRLVYEISVPITFVDENSLREDKRLRFRPIDSGLCKVLLGDDHPDFSRLYDEFRAPFVGDRDVMKLPEFTDDDITSARFAILRVRTPAGYDERKPEYEPEICPDCGCGAPDGDGMAIKRPKSVSKDFVGVHDSMNILCRTSIWRDLLAPLGVDCRPVFTPGRKAVIDDLVLLHAEEFVPVVKPGFEHSECSRCGESVIHHTAFDGWSPAPAVAPRGLLFRAAEWTGARYRREREWMVTQEFIQVVLRNKLTNIEFLPCDPSVVTRER